MITKVENTEVVPETTHSWTAYKCSDCGKEFDDERDANKHYGKQHAVAATTTFGPDKRKAYLLLTKEAWLAWLNSFHIDGWVYDGGWRGPGWYVLDRTSEPCGKGCCYKDCVGASSV